MLLATQHGSRGMMKFGFKIRTRSGLVVDNLLIPGKDQARQVDLEPPLRAFSRRA